MCAFRVSGAECYVGQGFPELVHARGGDLGAAEVHLQELCQTLEVFQPGVGVIVGERFDFRQSGH
jgi:hypothetical protein